ncbi:MAG: UvrD-helicase domain-containing protein, partial [Xanthomonadales bacterium]|nr:UvrD-helicase domain-containing protein [Xanthomonadales bacterium]
MNAALDVAALPLRGLHLIEASAGTGKTYTIGLLYLRLLLEGDAGLRGIAVVTFTEAATRELRERLRRRVGEGLRSLRGAPSADAGLDSVLAAHRDGAERQQLAIERLEAALTGFDEAFVTTIHGFCRQLLADTAFENGLPFIELDADATGPDVLELVRDYWRLHVVSGGGESAREAAAHWREPDVLARALATSQALAFDPSAVDPVDARGGLERAQSACDAARVEWQACIADGRAARALAQLADAALDQRISVARDGIHHPAALAACAEAIRTTPPAFGDLRPLHRRNLHAAAARARRKGWRPDVELDAVAAIVERLLDAADAVRRARRALFFVDALAFVRTGLVERRERLHRFGFDDLIRVLHERLHGPGGDALARTIARRLPALLVDEFQDTDPLQYAILRRLHAAREDGVMFLIGDPKQAIYRFRGGDVFTYRLAARDAGANVHALVHNWRSDARLVAAVNAVFGRNADAFVHPFIGFAPAAYPAAKRRKPEIAEATAPLVIWRLADPANASGEPKPWTTDAFAARVLAETASAIKRSLVDARENGRAPTIAVLVNTNEQARQAAATLARWNIACDHLGTESVYESGEAESLARVLAALA